MIIFGNKYKYLHHAMSHMNMLTTSHVLIILLTYNPVPWKYLNMILKILDYSSVSSLSLGTAPNLLTSKSTIIGTKSSQGTDFL